MANSWIDHLRKCAAEYRSKKPSKAKRGAMPGKVSARSSKISRAKRMDRLRQKRRKS